MSGVRLYRKKPVIIEALQFRGDNVEEVRQWVNSHPPCGADGVWTFSERVIVIPTLEGNLGVVKGDFIIRGLKGEFYPCKPDIFERTYEQIR